MTMNKKARIRIILIALAVVIVAAVAVYMLTADSRTYAAAKKYEESGDYDKAISVYSSIIDYQDASDRILACRYGIAEDLLTEGKYQEAYDAFISIADYSDVAKILSTDENMLFVADYRNKLGAFSTIGSIVQFGLWEQDNITDNGLEPIEWIVVAVDGTKSLLVSRNSIAYRPFANSFSSVTWNNSPLRKWLNEDFLNTAFAPPAREHLIPTKSSCDSSQSHSGYGTKDSYDDAVFLLSAAEVKSFFPSFESRKCEPTAAVQVSAKTVASTLSNAEDWWLRTSVSSEKRVETVGADGRFDTQQVNCYCGVRPAIWISTEPGQGLLEWDRKAYTRGTELLASGDYSRAIINFQQAGNCLDAQERLQECYYQLGEKKLSEGKYEDAYAAFIRAGNWGNAAQLLTENEDLRQVAYRHRLPVGSTVRMGTYKQDTESVNGQSFIAEDYLEWTVLDYQDGKALLITNQVIDYRPFGNDTSVWENSNLRSWLNNTFLETAFTEEEQAVIVMTTVDNSEQQNNPQSTEPGSADTQDRLYVLSYAEFMQYYPDQKSGKASPTSYVLQGGSGSSKKIKLEYTKIDWWLRSPCNTEYGWADAVHTSAISDHYLTYALKGTANYNGVRPVMWVDVTADYFAH